MTHAKGHFEIYPDEELMAMVARGQAGAFDELYARYGRRLFAYFFRMLNFNKEQAEDALQDLFLKIAESPARFDHSRPFSTWVFSVASNSCKNYYRHRQVVNNHREALEYIQDDTYHPDREFLDRAASMDGERFANMLREVLDELPPEKKEAFILKYQEDKTIAEIARIQECAEGSVKSRLHYTMKILEQKLKMFNPVIE